MVVSDARREANRRNALKSTGPTTAVGKATAAQNSCKHGFTAAGPGGPEEARGVAERVAAWQKEFRPRGDWQTWLVAELAGVSVRLERIAASEVVLRAVAARRAESLWDEDRRREVEHVGARLERDPAQVVATLRQSPHGCDWLIERWAALARLADGAGGPGWDEPATRLALDLLGTPAVGRGEPVGLMIDELGRTTAPASSPAALARERIAELQALRDRVGAADDLTRTLAASGLSDIPSREVATLRRYERATLRRMFWLKTQMNEAGLQPQALAPPATPVPPAEPKSTADAASSSPDAAKQRMERNEATLVRRSIATNPPRDQSQGDLAPGFATAPDQQRPDLAKLARREQQKRRARRSA